MKPLSFFRRLWMAFACFFLIAFRRSFAQAVLPAYEARKALPAGKAAGKPAELPGPAPEEQHRSGLFVLSLLQREGRLLDFLQEEVAPFPDAEVGAAARVVHEGCRKVLHEYLTLEPVMKEAEGAAVQVLAGFDARRIRLTGNVTGAAPYTGTVKHPGWVASSVRLPAVPEALDPRVLAPAEVELP